MIPGRPSLNGDRRAALVTLASELRPDLHRLRASHGIGNRGRGRRARHARPGFRGVARSRGGTPASAWLFRALDLLRGGKVRMAEEPSDADADVVDSAQPDPLVMLMRKDAVKTAVSRFAELPTLQRSVVILRRQLGSVTARVSASRFAG